MKITADVKISYDPETREGIHSMEEFDEKIFRELTIK